MTNIILLGHLVVDSRVWEVPLYILALVAGVVIVYFFRVHIAVKMAAKRNRSTVGWGLFSFFVSPIGAWILLALLGKYVSPDE
ncbi:MAG: hypothetical protein UH084_08660 [Paludibacteraceae bacterium]|nr:hypothetical protein [Paludibacteraceae bacterium]